MTESSEIEIVQNKSNKNLFFIFLEEVDGNHIKIISPEGNVISRDLELFSGPLSVSFNTMADLVKSGITEQQIKALEKYNSSLYSEPLELSNNHIWRYARLTFNRYKIEKLKPDQYFTIVVIPPGVSFKMTRREFEDSAPNIVRSESYQDLGSYNCKNLPAWVLRFKV